MKSNRTTYFAIAAAVGIYLWDLASVPYWVNIIGKCLVIIGNVGVGTAAADHRVVSQQANDIQKLKTDTASIQKP